MSSKTTELDKFFPLPSQTGPSPDSPARLPGVTRASSDALVKTLKDNHVKWHAFFNDRGFHNHGPHHLVAIYAMGASGPLLEAAYDTHVAYMRPSFESPEAITDENFWKHLGKKEFYNSYLEYFRAHLLKRGSAEVIEEFIFSVKANVGGHGIEGHPRMLNRFLAAIVHPMIHLGCGLEFGLPGLVAEGLAQAAVHPDQGQDILVPASLFGVTETTSRRVSRLGMMIPSALKIGRSTSSGGSGTVGSTTHAAKDKTASAHAFTIIARILADGKFSPASIGLTQEQMESKFDLVNKQVGQSLSDLAAEWAAELEENATPTVIQKKIEELVWMNAIIYGVGGWVGREQSPYKKFNADFFYMHLVTSSIFLSTIVQSLSPRSSTLLLRSYFGLTLTWYLAQGRPALPLRDFYAATTAFPSPPGTASLVSPSPAEGTLTPDVAAPNPWLPIVQTTLVHPGEHVCKTQRALMHGATLYGARTPEDFKGTELEGAAEVLDATLFIRIAGLTADRMGWMKEGEKTGEWDRMGFFEGKPEEPKDVQSGQQ